MRTAPDGVVVRGRVRILSKSDAEGMTSFFLVRRCFPAVIKYLPLWPYLRRLRHGVFWSMGGICIAS